MFRGLIKDAKRAAVSVVSKYVARASVAVPFVIALGFAIAAITVALVESFGHVKAYWIMAASLATLGLVAGALVTVKEQEVEVAEQKAQEADTASVAAEVATQAPLALLGTMLASPGGVTSALTAVRLLARNLPLVALVLIVGALLWASNDDKPVDATDADLPDPADDAGLARGKPNGFHAAETYP